MAVEQLRIAGVLPNVSLACDFVVDQARKAGLDERAIHHCYLAVDEACTNIIEHGYDDCDTCVIDVVCKHDADALTITIADDGTPFDPLKRPDPDPSAPLDERGTGGWGIFFMKKLMDDLSYSYTDGRNRLVMVKRIPRTRTQTREPAAIWSIERRTLIGMEAVSLITLNGRLDSSQSEALELALTEQLNAGHRWLILDMSDVDYIASAGLKMLVSVWQRSRDQKGDMALTALTPRVREVLEMIGLDLVFTITDLPDKAREYFSTKVKQR